MTRYHFDVQLTGVGSSPEEAWQDCIEGFSMEPGDVPPVLATEDELANTIECSICRRDVPRDEYYSKHMASHPCE